METECAVQCPFCGNIFELMIDSSIPQQEFVSDCENCCRPLLLTIEAEPGEVLNLRIEPG